MTKRSKNALLKHFGTLTSVTLLQRGTILYVDMLDIHVPTRINVCMFERMCVWLERRYSNRLGRSIKFGQLLPTYNVIGRCVSKLSWILRLYSERLGILCPYNKKNIVFDSKNIYYQLTITKHKYYIANH